MNTLRSLVIGVCVSLMPFAQLQALCSWRKVVNVDSGSSFWVVTGGERDLATDDFRTACAYLAKNC